MRNSNIDGYDIMNRPLPSDQAFLATEKLFHGIGQNKKQQVIRNQQMYDYHMYRNRLPWEMNPNAERMFNGYNENNDDNPYTQAEYRNQNELQPLYYDTVKTNSYGAFESESRLPIPLDNDQMYQYNANMQSQGLARMLAPITNESRMFKQRKSDRSYNDINRHNQAMQEHIFTPMNGYGQKPTGPEAGQFF